MVPVEAPVPATLDWDIWLGVAKARPYSPAYVPGSWRGFPDFGCGESATWHVNIMGTPNMALRLTAPTSVECLEQEGKGKYTFPKKSVIRFDFPARGGMPPVKVFWHDGLKAQPRIDGIPPNELLGDKDINGSVPIGDKGFVSTGPFPQRLALCLAREGGYSDPAQRCQPRICTIRGVHQHGRKVRPAPPGRQCDRRY